MVVTAISPVVAFAILVASVLGYLVGVIQTSAFSPAQQSVAVKGIAVKKQVADIDVKSSNDSSLRTSPTSLLLPLTTSERTADEDDKYTVSTLEAFVLENALKFGLNATVEPPSSCRLLTEELEGGAAVAAYTDALKNFTARQAAFPGSTDIRRRMRTEPKDSVCRSLRLHPDGVAAIFPNATLSHLSSKGFMEPIIPPMRHPKFCRDTSFLLNLEYLIHDFDQFCQSVKQTSRFVLIDMGASLDFHTGSTSPVVYLTAIYKQFGFPFDHIYSFEVTFKEPMEVFEKVPTELLASYHWINRPVSADPTSRHNPLFSILSQFDEDDFVVIKLDIDTPAVEMPLAEQLLNNATVYNKVDAFYFEHHVGMKELIRYWQRNIRGSVKDSLDLFQNMRRRGIAAHSWV